MPELVKFSRPSTLFCRTIAYRFRLGRLSGLSKSGRRRFDLFSGAALSKVLLNTLFRVYFRTNPNQLRCNNIYETKSCLSPNPA